MASEKKPRKNAASADSGPKEKVISSVAAVPPRTYDKYKTTVIPALTKQFSYTNPNQVPKLEKIVVNMGLGAAVTNSGRHLLRAVRKSAFTARKPVVTASRRRSS